MSRLHAVAIATSALLAGALAVLSACPAAEEDVPTEIGDACGEDVEKRCDKEAFLCLVVEGVGTCQAVPDGCDGSCDCIDASDVCPDGNIGGVCVSVVKRATVTCEFPAEGEGEGEGEGE